MINLKKHSVHVILFPVIHMTHRIHTSLTERARELRKNATRHEKHLWYDFLSTYPVKFRRQHIIYRFIADFYCPAAKLVIELDGSQHFTDDAQEYDAARTEIMETLGVRVLRFTNDDIDRRFAAVCDAIDCAVRSKVKA